MNARFDHKSNAISIDGFSVNPKSTKPSTSKKTFILGTDKVKIDIDGREAVVTVMAYVYADGKKKARK